MRDSGYELGELIHASTLSTVHRGRRRSDGLEVFVKTSTRQSNAEVVGSLQHELVICRMFDSPSLISAVELVETEAKTALVLASVPDSETLSERAARARLSVLEALTVALGILDGLTTMHARNVVHKDIKPDNVLVDRSLSRVVLIDFGIAAIVSRDEGSVAANAKLEGTLAFMPPEQTGRIARPIDYRSDYYAFGATLYWMLAGEPPFGSLREPEELVHAHVARVPRPLDADSRGRSKIPPALARIVAKLLAKAGEDRYQGSFGLRADLRRCADELAAGGWPDFEIASIDPSEQLRLPARLFGRQAQLERLRAAYDASVHETEVVVLRGPPGSGKTSLAREFLASLASDTVVVTGGFVSDAGAESLTSITALLRALIIEQIDADPHREAALELRLRAAIGSNAALLSEQIPELASLLGPAPAIPSVGPGQARDRFFDTLARLVVALLLPERRHVVFVDDLQWTDELGARTVEALCVEPQRGSLIVLAIRDDASASEHPAAAMLERIHARGRSVLELSLDPLTPRDLDALVQQTLGRAPGSTELAALIHQRTHGSPLFVVQLLHSLYGEGVIEIDRATGRWSIDLAGAKRSESSGDVVDYLVKGFAKLPPAIRRVLGIAACFGSGFELEPLREIAGEQTDAAVHEATAGAYLLSASVGRGASGGSRTTSGAAAIEYRFAHERLRQVALAAAPEDRKAVHLVIARRLMLARGVAEPHCSAVSRFEQLSRIAEHVGHAVELIDDRDEREQLAAICEAAGVTAKASATYPVAARHFETALRLRADAPAAGQLSVALELGECLTMAGSVVAADRVFVRARALVGDRRERIGLLRVRGLLALVRDDRERALEFVIEAAELFDLDLRRGGSKEWLGGLIGGFAAEFAQLTPERIATLPELDDPERAHLIELLSAATYPAYVSGDFNLFIALLIACIRETLAHGLYDMVAQCFVQYGVVFAAVFNDHESARRCAALGFAILERFPDSPVAGQAKFVYYGTYQYLLEPLGESLAALSDSYVKLRAAGALIPAIYAVSGRLAHELYMGVPLGQTVAGILDVLAFAKAIPDTSQTRLAQVYLAANRALSEGDANPAELRPPGVDSDEELFEGVSVTVTFLIHATRAYVALMLEDRPATQAALRRAEPLAHAATGQLAAAFCEVVGVVHGCLVFDELDPAQAAAHAQRVDALLTSLARWELSCPANATPLRCLVDGAWALARGQLERAFEALGLAADAAAVAGFNAVEGLACELAGRAALGLGQRRHANGFLADALQAYARLGSLPLQRRVRDALRERGRLSLSSTGETSSSALAGERRSLDLASIIKMSQAILEANELEQVIGRLLAAVTENAGADRCVLLLDEAEGLGIRAERRADGELYLLDEGLRLSSAEQLLPRSLVLASARANEAVIVDDALRDPRCMRDPYVRAARVRALLLVPVFTGSRRVGLLYLENHLTPGAFTSRHVQVAVTLAAQAAVSIENARLFDALREGEAQWRAVVSGAPDIVLVVDRRRRVEFANRGGYGLDAAQVIGVLAEHLVTRDDRPRMIAATDFVFETGVGTSFETTVETPMGPRRFTTRVGPVSRDGEVQRLILIATDVTEQRRLEAELRHSQKMQAIGTLAGGIAHDFNNLLTVIIGACDLCTMYATDNEPLLSGLAEIDGAAVRAASLTRQLLAFSRKQTLQPKRFDLGELVRELASMLVRLLGDHVELELAPDSRPCPVFADPTQFSQVLVNLAVNARDAMPDGGVVRVSVEPRDGKIILTVTDTGVGMDVELTRKIFEPFFTTKDEGRGTGLGLSTVLGIVEQSGGRVEVDSELGRGTSFRIELPSADEVEAGPNAATASLPRGTETILLVEDELALQRLAARMLELQGYRVRIAATAEQAVAIAGELSELDLLVTDVMLPGSSGPKLAQRVLAEHPGAKLLYISGHATDEVLERGVELGTKNLLQKPFTREAIATRVRAILDHPGD